MSCRWTVVGPKTQEAIHVKILTGLPRGQAGLVGDRHLGLLWRSWCESTRAWAVGVGGAIAEALLPASSPGLGSARKPQPHTGRESSLSLSPYYP